jgi:hypothetical protein
VAHAAAASGTGSGRGAAGALIRALAHGAADLGFAGHLQVGGKGHAAPEQLVDDLLSYLHTAASAPVG